MRWNSRCSWLEWMVGKLMVTLMVLMLSKQFGSMGAHPKLENFKDKAGTRELCVVSRKKSPRMSPILWISFSQRLSWNLKWDACNGKGKEIERLLLQSGEHLRFEMRPSGLGISSETQLLRRRSKLTSVRAMSRLCQDLRQKIWKQGHIKRPLREMWWTYDESVCIDHYVWEAWWTHLQQWKRQAFLPLLCSSRLPFLIRQAVHRRVSFDDEKTEDHKLPLATSSQILQFAERWEKVMH